MNGLLLLGKTKKPQLPIPLPTGGHATPLRLQGILESTGRSTICLLFCPCICLSVRFIERMNAPTGSTLLMDNIAFHHSKETKNAVALKGWTQLFIPPYSPRVNPIENVFGVIKRKYRYLCTKLISPQSAQQCKEMFEGVLEQIGFLHPYFRHVSVFVAKTILDGGIGFSGYDDGSFVRVIVV